MIFLILTSVFTSCEESVTDTHKKLNRIAKSFEKDPVEDTLRELLNTPSDGAISYLKMALVGQAFGNNPELFKRIASSLETNEERESYLWVTEYGANVFEYYPVLKPEGFDKAYSEAIWLDKASNKSSPAQ